MREGTIFYNVIVPTMDENNPNIVLAHVGKVDIQGYIFENGLSEADSVSEK